MAVLVVSDGSDGTIRTQSNGVSVPDSYGNDVRPVGHIALAVLVVSDGNDGTIRTKSNGVLTSGGNHLPGGNTVPQAAALLRRVGIIPQLSKFDGGLSIVSYFHQGNRVLVTFLMIYSGNDHRYKQNYKRYAGAHDRYSYGKRFFALFCCYFSSNPLLLRLAFIRQTKRFNLLLAENDLLISILPAGNSFKNIDCILVRHRVFIGHLPLCRRITRIFAADFRFIKTPFGKGIRILKTGNAPKAISSRTVGILRIRAAHCVYGIVVYSGQTGVLVAVVNVGDIALQRTAKCLVAEADDFSEIIAVIKRFITIGKLLLFSDPQIRHQLSQIRLRALWIDIQHLFAILVGIAPIAVLQEDEGAFQQGRGVGGSLLYHHGFFGRGLVGFRQLLDATDQVLHEAQLGHILRL